MYNFILYKKYPKIQHFTFANFFGFTAGKWMQSSWLQLDIKWDNFNATVK